MDTEKKAAKAVASHEHEEWMIREAPDGSFYCAACGATVER